MDYTEFSRYETARILGARALQIAMNAPLLIKITEEDLEKIKYDALKIAEIEFKSNILPISVKKPLPQKKEDKLRRTREQRLQQNEEPDEKEENEIAKEDEIMELANPDDEMEESAGAEENEME